MRYLKEEAKEVLSLIEEGMSLSMISHLLLMSYERIYEIISLLKMNGFNIYEKYYSNGDIRYFINKNAKLVSQYKNAIITSFDENEMDMMLVSDFHLGSNSETKSLIMEIYDYCIKNNIHLLLNAGDLVEGMVNIKNIKIPWDEQIYYALRDYPMVHEILSFVLLGNHDHSLLLNYGQDIRKVINNLRGDIIPLGFGESSVKIKNDFIVMQHPLNIKKITSSYYQNKIIIRGHGHESKIKVDGNNYIINLPSVSNLNFNKSHHPGAVLMHLKMKSGNIINIVLDELIFINKKLYTTCSINLFTGKGKNYQENREILFEEDYQKVLRKE